LVSDRDGEHKKLAMGEKVEASGPAEGSRSGDADQPWSGFLSEKAALILQVVHLFERDPDQVQDCFLFVCERLRRDNLRRIRSFRSPGPASFSTWLRAVVRHLCLDWRRHRDGRFRLPSAIGRLPELHQEIFRCIHLRGLSENEAFQAVKALWPGLSRDQFVDTVAEVGKNLHGRQPWFLLVRHPRMQSLSAVRPGDDPAEGEAGLVDPRADPEQETATHEQAAVLRKALEQLPARARLLVQLRYEQELTLEEIATLTGLSGTAQVERLIHQALEALRNRMSAQGFASLSVKEK